ncbi:MAG: NAD(P)/FAD-dependent oxidoreductase [Ilumatobacter sp.]
MAARKRASRASAKRQHVNGVLIVGGGYAGVHAARAVRFVGRHACIIDPSGRHDFVTRLAAVAGGTAPMSDASASLEDFADRVIEASVRAIRDGEVDLEDGTTVTADAVVVTAGAVATQPPIDGIEHGRVLRTEGDAIALRGDIESTDAVVIIGGGATGVQLAGAVASAHPGVAVTIIDSADRVLAAMSSVIGRDAERILRSRGVDLRLGSAVDSIDTAGVVVDGERIDGLPVWAAGFEARGDRLGLPVDTAGRVAVDRFLRVDGWKHTFAAGDVAAHVDAAGEQLAMSAQIAVQAGEIAGKNAARLLRGDTLDRSRLSHSGWVLDLGGNRGLAELGGLALTAPFLDLVPPLLHWTIDLKHLLDTRGAAGLANRPGA